MGRFLNFIGYDNSLETKERFTYIISGFSVFLVSLFLIFYIFIIRSVSVNWITAFCLLDLFFVFFLLKIRKFSAAKFFLLFGFLFQECFLVFFWFPAEANFNYFFFIIAPITFFIFDFQKKGERVIILGLNILVALLLLGSEIIPPTVPLIELSENMAGLFTILTILSTVLSIFVVFYYYAFHLHQTYRELNYLAETDSLTRISNRRSLFREGRGLFSLCRDFGKSFSLMIVDVDHFKQINDLYGHLEGDRILCQMTELLSHNTRKEDTLSRYGGEEFAIILRETTAEVNWKIAENLRRKVEEYTFTIKEKSSLNLTISIGVAVLDSTHQGFDDLVASADRAMYLAKESGRNQVKASFHLEEQNG